MTGSQLALAIQIETKRGRDSFKSAEIHIARSGQFIDAVAELLTRKGWVLA